MLPFAAEAAKPVVKPKGLVALGASLGGGVRKGAPPASASGSRARPALDTRPSRVGAKTPADPKLDGDSGYP